FLLLQGTSALGTDGGSRTPTPHSTGSYDQSVYQFRHVRSCSSGRHGPDEGGKDNLFGPEDYLRRPFATLMKRADPAQITTPELHGYLVGAVGPRPIALASTIDPEGRPNLSPFSFFNVFGANP